MIPFELFAWQKPHPGSALLTALNILVIQKTRKACNLARIQNICSSSMTRAGAGFVTRKRFQPSSHKELASHIPVSVEEHRPGGGALTRSAVAISQSTKSLVRVYKQQFRKQFSL